MGLFDFFQDPQAQQDMLENLRGIKRGLLFGGGPGILGGPVDIANMAMLNAGGDIPVGGSEWWDKVLQKSGMAEPRKGTLQETVGGLASMVFNPLNAAAAIPTLETNAAKGLLKIPGSPGTQEGVISPSRAMKLNTAPTMPIAPQFREAIANTPGAQIADRGLLLNVTRSQQPEQALENSVRGGVFYLPEGAAQTKYYSTGGTGYGGPEKISGQTLIQNPILGKGGTGGNAPKDAFDAAFGKGTYETVRTEALKAATGWNMSRADRNAAVQSFLEKYAPEMADQAENIIANSAKSNQLPYALQEAAVASGLRQKGYDAVVGYSRQKSGNPFISEVFDLRERTYPDKFGTPTKVWEAYQPKAPEGGLLSQALPTQEAQAPPLIKRAAPQYVAKPNRFQSGEKEGIYRGSEAFGGITPAKLGSMRTKYIEDALAGAPYSKYWYDDTSKDLWRLAGQNVSKADNLADVLATTSSSTPVGSNAMYGFKGWNQNLVGDPIVTGKYPTRMSEDIGNIFAGTQNASGLKRSPYAGGLSVEWRPDPSLLAVNDIHNLRAWGINDPKTGKPWSKGVGEAGHRFLQDQHAIITERLNDQAAANITAARQMGVPEEQIAKMDQPDWTNYRAQAAAWSKQRASGPNQIPLAESGKHYGDFLPEYAAQITREWTPGKTTGHAQGLLSMSQADQQKFADAMEKVVTAPGGIDRLASGLGALTDRTLPNAGIYEGRSAPGFVSQVMVGKGLGSQAIDPASAKAVDAITASHGLLGVQDQSAWNYLGGPAPLKEAGAFQLQRGKAFTPEELVALRQRVPNADVPQVDPRGARVLSFDPEANKGLLGELRTAVKGTGATVVPKYRSSNLFPVDENFKAPATWSAKPYVEKIEAGGPKLVENWNKAVPPIAADLLKVSEQFFAQHGLQDAPFYKPMMEGIAKGGLPELKRLIAAGIVPVAVLAALGLTQEQAGLAPTQ